MRTIAILSFALTVILGAPFALYGEESTEGPLHTKARTSEARSVETPSEEPAIETIEAELPTRSLFLEPQPMSACGGGPPLPYCGDFCSTPGCGRGCIDNSSGHWKRTPCTCQNGAWLCGSW